MWGQLHCFNVVRLERESMRCYRCKVKIVRDWEVIVYAKNKKEAADEAPPVYAQLVGDFL